MIEETILQFVINNGVGVFFGVLLYKLANDQIKKNTEALGKLHEVINNLCSALNFKKK